MKQIKVKFCGLKKHHELHWAAESGADAVGFVLVEKSPRYVDMELAKELIDAAKKMQLITVVLFADHPAEYVNKVIDSCYPDVLQFHGFETAGFCEQFKHRYWKAIPMLSTADYLSYFDQYPNAEAFLLDTFGKQQSGGSGHAFEWFQFPEQHKEKMILAGGLHENNVADAILSTGAEFIDISSGIEEMKGVKSANKMMSFMQQVKAIEIT
ncbi:phosphoribosylanthranilate isomerase [Marinicella sp. S1101]|uniref:phosphoribosylanthranilate isomerase n=1 Tax=Marinicella marina TaxID=2996016 RepID=UPI0022608913|nr:phosphoribosylanthranilate isomerase [Marinicella marina]MCX7554442.1 phosphoribosylanthranilate isomerase [Marinicella marina]MDJ1140593.1 phosphoribosylanthranilate isomerase [Marinicella marina]